MDKPAVLSFLTGFLHHDYEKERKKKYPYNSERYSNDFNDRFNRPGVKPDCDHKKWYWGFTKRHPDLKKRVPEHITKARADVNKTMIFQWFSDIECYHRRPRFIRSLEG